MVKDIDYDVVAGIIAPVLTYKYGGKGSDADEATFEEYAESLEVVVEGLTCLADILMEQIPPQVAHAAGMKIHILYSDSVVGEMRIRAGDE